MYTYQFREHLFQRFFECHSVFVQGKMILLQLLWELEPILQKFQFPMKVSNVIEGSISKATCNSKLTPLSDLV